MTMPESRVERDRELRNWRPEFEVEPEMSPAKRQKMDATSSLYRKLVGHVLTVMQEREERDTRERAKSKDIAKRYPLTFMDDAINVGCRQSPPRAVSEMHQLRPWIAGATFMEGKAWKQPPTDHWHQSQGLPPVGPEH